ncbi:MAG: YscO family type III secretion system apparatus protein [Gammaproteobacteria bacterium]|nr:YscO family type III secretion system apparatus protein [Gammaproteobacteria bacterium]
MFKQIFTIKKRREDNAVKAERISRLNLEQAVAAVQAEVQRKSDYEQWAVTERARLFEQLQQHEAIKYNDLMQWNAQVADIKQGRIDIEERIVALEHEREQKKAAHEQAALQRQAAEREAIRFEELVREEEREERMEQERYEEREMEDFRPPAELA